MRVAVCPRGVKKMLNKRHFGGCSSGSVDQLPHSDHAGEKVGSVRGRSDRVGGNGTENGARVSNCTRTGGTARASSDSAVRQI